MTIYNTIKSIGRKAKYALLGGLAALVIGCAPARQDVMQSPFPTRETAKVIQEAPKTSRTNAYFCPRFGILNVLSQKDNTSPDYTGSYDTWGIEFGYEGENLEVRVSYDAFHADKHDDVNGTGVDVSLDGDIVGISLLGNKKLGNSPFTFEYGGNISKILQNVRRDVGAPYNETDNSVESAYTIGPNVGIEVKGKRGYARLGCSYNIYVDSDCVESDSRITLSGGFMF